MSWDRDPFRWEGWRWGSLARMDDIGDWIEGAQHLVATDVPHPEFDWAYRVACGGGPRTGHEIGFDFIPGDRAKYGKCSRCLKIERRRPDTEGGENP